MEIRLCSSISEISSVPDEYLGLLHPIIQRVTRLDLYIGFCSMIIYDFIIFNNSERDILLYTGIPLQSREPSALYKKSHIVLGNLNNIYDTLENSTCIYFRKRFSIDTYQHKVGRTSIDACDFSFMHWYRARFGLRDGIITRFLKFLGLSSTNKTRIRDYYISDFPKLEISSFFNTVNTHLDGALAQFMFERQRAIITLNSRRGLRMLAGLPCNGQRTRVNGKTPKKFPYYYDIRLATPQTRSVLTEPVQQITSK